MTLRRTTSILAVLLVGLSAGFFFAYEVSVTLGLAEVDDVTYVRAFQAINDRVSNAGFAIAFFGSIPALGAAVASHWRAGRTAQVLTAGALAAYVIGVAITGVGNVPLNDDLADVVDITPATASVVSAATATAAITA